MERTITQKLKLLTGKTFLKFLAAGISAVIVDYGSFHVLFVVLDVPLFAANSLSFCLGLVTSFSLNRLWTFAHGEYSKKASHQLSYYVALAFLNLLLTNVFVWSFTHVGINPRIGKIITIAIIATWNFVLYKFLIFTHNTTNKT